MMEDSFDDSFFLDFVGGTFLDDIEDIGNEKPPIVDADKLYQVPTQSTGPSQMLPQKQAASSYWSVPEQQDFAKYVGHFGRDFASMSAHMGTKTQTMCKNHFERQIEGGRRPKLERSANEADERRARGEGMGRPPEPTPIRSLEYDHRLERPIRYLEHLTSEPTLPPPSLDVPPHKQISKPYDILSPLSHYATSHGGGSTSESKAKRANTPKLLSCTKCRERKVKCDRMKPCSACCARGHPKDCEFVIREGNDYSQIQLSHELRKLHQKNELLKQRMESMLQVSSDLTQSSSTPNSIAPKKQVWHCPYEGCYLSSKVWRTRSALNKHTRTHMPRAMRPHRCVLCDSAFLYPKDLQRHIQAVHQNVGYPCTICNTRFKRQEDLMRHVKNKHTEPASSLKSPPGTPTLENQEEPQHSRPSLLMAEAEVLAFNNPAESTAAGKGALHTIPPTMTDEGNWSLNISEVSKADDKILSDTESVRTDNRDSTLPRNVKNQLSIEFAQEILDSVQLAGEELTDSVREICSLLPSLLRDFSLLMETHSGPDLEQRACTFVRHQRQLISQNMRAIISNKPDSSDAPRGRDRIDLLWGTNRNIDESPNDRLTSDGPEDIDRQDQELIDHPEIREARRYLVQSSEFRWLLSRIRSIAMTMATGSTDIEVRQNIITIVQSSRNLLLELDWHLPSFLEEQYNRDDDVQPRQVLCCSGRADKAYAGPSIEYADLVWPRLGKETIQCLSDILQKKSTRATGVLSDGTDLMVETRSQTTNVRVTGDTASIVEIAEVLVWLSTSCKASPKSDAITYCQPHISSTGDAYNPTCKISYSYWEVASSPEDDQKETADCWHKMFRNPVIAYGYPIPTRKNDERGLEVSLEIMACLGATPWVINFCQTVLLKGFCSLFVPMMRVGGSIIWHFLLNSNGERISYNKGLVLGPVVDEFSLPELEKRRHFVGWTLDAGILAGTKIAKYDISRSASDLSKPGIGALSGVSISGGKVLQFGASFVRGTKDTPVPIANSRPYEMQVLAASDMLVNFYDTDTQRNWLLDGATSLLHLTRAWLSSSYARFIPVGTLDEFSHATTYKGRESALEALVSTDNRQLKLFSSKIRLTETVQDPSGPIKVDKCKETWWCWEDLVQLKWNVLEQIHDHMVRLRTSPPTDLRVPLASQGLEGFDFNDLLSDNSQIRPRTVDLQSSAGNWLDIVKQNDVVNIFGSGFGELILPVKQTKDQSSPHCSQQSPVPEDLDYLAAPMYVLKDIASKYRTKRDTSISLGESIYWVDPDTYLDKCVCVTMKDIKCPVPLSQLQSLPISLGKKRSNQANADPFTAHPQGAVIFGNKPNWSQRRKLGKRKLQSNDSNQRNTKPRGSDSGVDVGTSSTSGNASSPSQSQCSLGDSGISDQQST